MDHSTAVVIAAAVGAVAAVCGQTLQAWRQSSVERAKIELERTKLNHGQVASLHSEMRSTLQSAIQKMASATHSMCWLTWIGKEAPNRFSQRELTRYDEEMHGLLPEIIGLQARIASYTPELGTRFHELTSRIEDLDERIARSAIAVVDGLITANEVMPELHRESAVIHEQLSHLCQEGPMGSFVPRV